MTEAQETALQPKQVKNNLKGGTVTRSKEIYRLRALEMVDRRVHNIPIDKIAEEFNCHPDTVRRSLAWARREGAVEQLEQRIINDLGSLAIKVYQEQLAQGNEYIAKDVIANIMKLGDRFSSREAQQEEQSLRAYIESKRDDRSQQRQPATIRTYRDVTPKADDERGTTEAVFPESSLPIIDITPERAAGD